MVLLGVIVTSTLPIDSKGEKKPKEIKKKKKYSNRIANKMKKN